MVEGSLASTNSYLKTEAFATYDYVVDKLLDYKGLYSFLKNNYD